MLTKEMVKKSIEARWRKGQIRMYFIIFSFFEVLGLIIGVVFGMHTGEFHITFTIIGIILLVFCIVFLPFIFYFLYKYLKLFKYLEDYIIYEVTLDKPSTSFMYRGSVYYTITFITEANEKITRDTRPLWSSSILASFSLEEYNNKKVKIAYNENLDCLIVLG